MRVIHSSLLSDHTDNLLHAFTTRIEGFSLKPFYQNNLAYHVNDDPKKVQQNHMRLAQYLDYDFERLVHMDQVHGDTIKIIDNDSDLNHIPQCDALITKEKNIPLMVMVADCIPIMIYDKEEKVIAVVHAGRAGVFAQLLPKTLKTMQMRFNSNKQNLIIVLGPSIHKCCYEVGKEIKEEAEKLGYAYAIHSDNGNYYLDLISIIKEQLQDMNILKENIEYSPFCTSCHKDLFFSYRAENKITGRFCGLLKLK